MQNNKSRCHRLLYACLCLLCLLQNSQLEKVPSALNIEEYDDPLLDEIFADTNSDSPLPSSLAQQAQASVGRAAEQSTAHINEHAHLLAASASPPPAIAAAAKNAPVIDPNVKPPAGSIFSNPALNNLPGATDNIGAEAFQPSSAAGGAGLDRAAASNAFAAGPLTDLAFQAGQNFYTGVRQAGRLLGIDAGQYQPYEVPLLSGGARLFGRRK